MKKKCGHEGKERTEGRYYYDTEKIMKNGEWRMENRRMETKRWEMN